MGAKPPVLAYEAVDRNVLFVAAEVGPNEWAAFVGAIEGEDRERDLGEVTKNGSALPFELAEVFFEDYARDPDRKYRPDLRPLGAGLGNHVVS